MLSQGGFGEKTVELAKDLLAAVLRWASSVPFKISSIEMSPLPGVDGPVPQVFLHFSVSNFAKPSGPLLSFFLSCFLMYNFTYICFSMTYLYQMDSPRTFMFSGKAEMGRDFYVKIVNADKEVCSRLFYVFCCSRIIKDTFTDLCSGETGA